MKFNRCYKVLLLAMIIIINQVYSIESAMKAKNVMICINISYLNRNWDQSQIVVN